VVGVAIQGVSRNQTVIPPIFSNVPFTDPPFTARRKFSELILIIDWRLEQDYYGRHVHRRMMA
jgi:hypothetical protein